jgi:hypothetical protein
VTRCLYYNSSCILLIFFVNAVNGQNRRTQIVVQLLDPGLRARTKGSLPPEELDQALDWLSEKVERQEKSKVLQLEALFTALSRYVHKTVYKNIFWSV